MTSEDIHINRTIPASTAGRGVLLPGSGKVVSPDTLPVGVSALVCAAVEETRVESTEESVPADPLAESSVVVKASIVLAPDTPLLTVVTLVASVLLCANVSVLGVGTVAVFVVGL